jgi:hypothetical protein
VSVFGLADEKFACKKCEESTDYYLRAIQDRKWTDIICEYSSRDVMVFGDHLPALARIATEFAKSWNDI